MSNTLNVTTGAGSALPDLLRRVEAEEASNRDQAWGLHKKHQREDGSYKLGKAHAFGEVVTMLKALIATGNAEPAQVENPGPGITK